MLEEAIPIGVTLNTELHLLTVAVNPYKIDTANASFQVRFFMLSKDCNWNKQHQTIGRMVWKETKTERRYAEWYEIYFSVGLKIGFFGDFRIGFYGQRICFGSY